MAAGKRSFQGRAGCSITGARDHYRPRPRPGITGLSEALKVSKLRATPGSDEWLRLLAKILDEVEPQLQQLSAAFMDSHAAEWWRAVQDQASPDPSEHALEHTLLHESYVADTDRLLSKRMAAMGTSAKEAATLLAGLEQPHADTAAEPAAAARGALRRLSEMADFTYFATGMNARRRLAEQEGLSEEAGQGRRLGLKNTNK